MINLFKKKDKNALSDKAISDILIYYTLNLFGKDKNEVIEFCQDLDLTEKEAEDGITSYLTLLDNNCILGIMMENNKVFKVNIWLNNKVSKTDQKNLEIFTITHDSEYYFFNLKDKSVGRYLIAFESKIY